MHSAPIKQAASASDNISEDGWGSYGKEKEWTLGKLTKDQVLIRMADGLYLNHPEIWPLHAMGTRLDQWQKRTMAKLFTGEKHRMSVRAGHGAGKTKLASIIVHYFLLNFIPSKVIISGPTGKQTRSQHWAYLNDAWNDSVFKDDIEWQRTKMFIKGEGNEENWFATWVSSKNPKNMEGFHGPLEGRNLLWIIEEAKGVQDAAFEALSGALSNDDNYLYISSTCGPPHGFFYRSHTSLRHMFDTEHIPSTQSSRVSEKQIDIWRVQYGGEDSPIFQARVLANFPEDSDFAIVSLAMLEKAVEQNDDIGEFLSA